MVQQNFSYQQKVYYDTTTTNQSFLQMHYYLKQTGIKNNMFMLSIFDPDLIGIDPRDPRLNRMMKLKIIKEVQNNLWYFLRTVVRIPVQGGAVGSGIMYQLHRGNMAMTFGYIMNWCMFVELPRQNGKSISSCANYLWSFNFGTTNSEFMFINKSLADSKMNLERLKDLRDALPDYLRMDQPIRDRDGKLIKPKSNVESLEHIINGNKIKTLASASSEAAANSRGRGCTQPYQWYDEHAFIPHVDLVYKSATPAYKTASQNARNNGKGYGILITTTPGDLTTKSGKASNAVRLAATPFDESFYDIPFNDLQQIIARNTNSPFVYIRYTYQQLGRSEQWFKEICVDMLKDWAAIRREVLLEWSTASDNSPFTKEDLNKVKQWVVQEPLHKILIRGYIIKIYSQMDPNVSMFQYPPLIGVDVSGGYMKDSSAVSIIDSKDTKFVGELYCNYITQDDLAAVIYDLVTMYMPTAVVNIERNGGFGAAVLSKLSRTKIKRNLYYEIKDRVLEEHVGQGNINKVRRKTKCFGFDNTKHSRNRLMDILRNRMDLHKDKFISPTLYHELEGLVIDHKTGRIDHSSETHDDLVFSYLLALYMYYDGHNMKENWGMDRRELTTDEELDEVINDISEKEYNIMRELGLMENDEVKSQLDKLDKSMLYEEWANKEYQKDQKALNDLLRNNPRALQEYARMNALDPEELKRQTCNGTFQVPMSVFDMDHIDDEYLNV